MRKNTRKAPNMDTFYAVPSIISSSNSKKRRENIPITSLSLISIFFSIYYNFQLSRLLITSKNLLFFLSVLCILEAFHLETATSLSQDNSIRWHITFSYLLVEYVICIVGWLFRQAILSASQAVFPWALKSEISWQTEWKFYQYYCFQNAG